MRPSGPQYEFISRA